MNKNSLINSSIEEESIMIGEYYINNNYSTYRSIACEYNTSKTRVFNLIQKLKYIDINLYIRCRNKACNNFKVKYLRGGISTRKKFISNKILKDKTYKIVLCFINGMSIVSISKENNISTNTVRYNLNRIRFYDPILYDKCRNIINSNKRGGDFK
jgi:hypothetical protein